MSRTLLDVDDEALTEAMAELGTTTKVDTVNQALREVAARRAAKRQAALGVFDQMAANLEGYDRDQAWRRSG